MTNVVLNGVQTGEALLVAAERPALQLPPRRAAPDDFKKRTISRAESGQLKRVLGASS